MSDKSFVVSKEYQQHALQEMLVSLLNLTVEIYEDGDMSRADKIYPLCEGYEMILKLMKEIETQETK